MPPCYCAFCYTDIRRLIVSDARGKTYRPWAPQHYRHEAPSPAAKLPEGDLVFFLLDTVPPLDLRRFYAPDEHETRGAPPFAPKMMVCWLLYAYCVGVFSSRKIAQACERNLAFIAVVGEHRPDFAPSAIFASGPLGPFWTCLCRGCVSRASRVWGQRGNVSTDGTTLQGHASWHKAMSSGSMKKEVERLREAMEALVTQAYQQDAEADAALGSRRGDALPAELSRRADRLATIEAAMQRLEARAKADAEAER